MLYSNVCSCYALEEVMLMIDVNNTEEKHYVNIAGKAPNIRLTLLDSNGKQENFKITEMLLYGYKKEEDQSRQEKDVVYYKGKIQLRDYPNKVIRTRMFKYILDGKKWYLYGDIEELIKWKRI